MPFTGESIVDGILVSWLVEPGSEVKKGEHLAEIETEKSVWEFESPCDGKVIALRAEPGDVVDVEAPLLELSTSDENMRHLVKTNGDIDKRELSYASTGADSDTASSLATPVSVDPRSSGSGAGVQISPRVKRLIAENGLTVEEITDFAGLKGKTRLAATDIEEFLNERSETAMPAFSVSGSGALTACYMAGLGTFVPDTVVNNTVFAEDFPDISVDYIEKVTGIRERRWVATETTSDMAIEAAKDALASAEVAPEEIDLIVLATTTPDMPVPATACAVQMALGCRAIPAFDLQAACSGWLYGLSVGQQFISTGTYKNVLVIAAESMSTFTDKTDRATAFLFGDGAGAAVLSSEKKGHRLSEMILEADSTGYDIIYRRAGGAAMPPGRMSSPRDQFWHMDGGRMFRSAVAGFSHVIERVAQTATLALKDVKWFVPHQANQRILKSVARQIRTLPEKFFSNIRHFGNTSAASIPLALKDLERSKKVRAGDKILLCAVGAGLTSAGCVVTW